jgi:hypothetical protein
VSDLYLTYFFLQWKPNYLWWWLIYQAVFIIATAGIVILFIRLKDEKFGILSYLKNYLMRVLITLFVTINLVFVLLLIYFWLNILSLYKFLKKGNRKKVKEIVAESRVNLTSDMKAQSIAGSNGAIQLIPLNMKQNENSDESGLKENSKFFIIHV